MDALVGIHDRTVTAGARCILCTLGVIQDFKQPAEDLLTVTEIRVASELLRQIVESEGRRVMESCLSGGFEPGWSASEAEQVYVGVDGVMVRGVTEVEKKKRRQQHESRSLLDFYHLSEHIWDAAKGCLGDTDAAGKWARAQLHEIKHVGAAAVLDALAVLSKKVRASHKKKRLRVLREYITARWEMVEYPKALCSPLPTFSGPVLRGGFQFDAFDQ